MEKSTPDVANPATSSNTADVNTESQTTSSTTPNTTTASSSNSSSNTNASTSSTVTAGLSMWRLLSPAYWFGSNTTSNAATLSTTPPPAMATITTTTSTTAPTASMRVMVNADDAVPAATVTTPAPTTPKTTAHLSIDTSLSTPSLPYALVPAMIRQTPVHEPMDSDTTLMDPSETEKIEEIQGINETKRERSRSRSR